MNRKLLASVACIAVASGLAASPSFAQEQNSDGSSDARRLDAVTVTAQRASESMQDVPVAVTAISSDALEDRQIGDVLDLQFQVPNINMGTNTGTANAARIFLRGVGEDESRGMVDQAVGIYVDGIYVGRSVGSLFDLVDLESIEVLRGPQGTLYGRNTIGGAIKLQSVKPKMENSGDVRTTVGNNGRLDLRGTANIKVADNTAFRITALKRERDGFFELKPNGAKAGEGRDVGRTDVFAVRASLLTEFNNDWSLYITADSTLDRSDPTPDSIKPGSDVDGNMFTIEPAPGTECTITSTATGCFTNYNQRSQSQGVSAQIDGKLGGYDFMSLTGYRTLEDDLITRIGSPYSQQTDQTQLSQEFTLSSNYEGPFNFVAGLYYFEEDLSLDSVFIFPFAISGTTESVALFTQGTYEVSDKLSLTGGIRYTQESKDFDGLNKSFNFARQDSADFDNVSYSVGADYRINESVLTYAKFATGYKSGGWSPDAFSSTAIFLPVDEEKLDSFEVGAKTDLFSNTVRLNAAYFFNTYEGLQIGATIPGVGFTRFNVPEAQIQGLEFEGAWQATENLQFNANLGLLKAEYTDLDLATAAGLTNQGATPACGGVVTLQCAYGLKLKNAPEYKGAIGVLYNVPVSSGALSLSADVGFEDESWSLVANSPVQALTTVSPLVNGRIKYESEAGWSTALWVKNAADQKYWRAAVAGGSNVYASDPITYGIDLGYKF
jgi:iron complex outermembrane recepter protein